MKKLVLIIGIVLCIAVIGSVFAIAVYDASPAKGTVNSDPAVYLRLNSTVSSGCTLRVGVATVIPVVLSIDKTDEWTNGSATLTVSAAATDSTKSIEKVSITLWNDQDCTSAIDGLTITGITEGRTIYIRLLLAEDATQDEVKKTSGDLTISFVAA